MRALTRDLVAGPVSAPRTSRACGDRSACSPIPGALRRLIATCLGGLRFRPDGPTEAGLVVRCLRADRTSVADPRRFGRLVVVAAVDCVTGRRGWLRPRWTPLVAVTGLHRRARVWLRRELTVPI